MIVGDNKPAPQNGSAAAAQKKKKKKTKKKKPQVATNYDSDNSADSDDDLQILGSAAAINPDTQKPEIGVSKVIVSSYEGNHMSMFLQFSIP
jgi:hypothetical protein